MWWWRIGPRPHPDPDKTHTAQSTERERGEKKNLSPRTGTRTDAGLTSDDNHGDQASGAHYQRLPTNELIAIPHHRGRNFGTVSARPGRRQDWIFFDGRGEVSPEILADFSSSDWIFALPACLPACLLTRPQSHASPSLMSRVDDELMCACSSLSLLVRCFLCAFSFSPFPPLHYCCKPGDDGLRKNAD